MSHSSGRVETSAGAVVVCRRSPDAVYLLILDAHGNWGFPKGHVEAEETLEDTARREVHEETGIAAGTNHGGIGVREWVFDSGGEPVTKVCHFFLFEVDRPEAVPQTEEGIAAVEWLTFDAARSRLTFASARSILHEADRQLNAPTGADRAGAG